jgi:hypothetical protein
MSVKLGRSHLREEGRLTGFENRVLRRIFGPKRDKVRGEWRKPHNEELNDLYCSRNIVRVIISRMRWAVHVARMGERRGKYRVLVEKPERKNQLEDPGLFGGVDWIDLAQDTDRWRALLNAVMNIRVP